MKVTACIVNWNTAAHLAGAVESLLAQDHADLELVVVDNASEDDSAAVARRYEDDVRLVVNLRNRGFAGAANQGLAVARENGSDAFLVCNPDIRAEPAYLARAVAALAADPRRAAVQGRLWRLPTEFAGGDERPAVRTIDTTGHLAFRTRLFRNRGTNEVDRGQYERPGEVFGVSGALALYRVEALDDVAVDDEVFDEDLFAFWEDIDLDWRLQLRGWKAWYAPGACAWHERGGEGPRRSAVVERLNFVNRFLVVLKNDDTDALRRAWPGFAATTLLKTGELAVTVPTAFLGAFRSLPLVPRMLAKRRLVHASATVDPAAVVDRWFAPFDYANWFRMWWRRVGPGSP